MRVIEFRLEETGSLWPGALEEQTESSGNHLDVRPLGGRANRTRALLLPQPEMDKRTGKRHPRPRQRMDSRTGSGE